MDAQTPNPLPQTLDGIVQHCPYTVQRIDTVPRCAAPLLGGEALGGRAVDRTMGAISQDLRQGRDEVVDGARREAVLRLGHQGAIAIVLVAGCAHTEDAIEGIISIRLAAIIEQVACGIVVICIIKSESELIR